MDLGGYVGKIAVIDLSKKSVETINTSDYEQYGGGHGLSTALFFKYCEDFGVGPLDEGNVLCISTTPFTGTIVPAASSRADVAAVSPYSYPKHWFHHSSIGGKFPAQLKYAGWDALVIKGKADKPTWIKIMDGDIAFEDASDLWGKDSWETQKAIIKKIRGIDDLNDSDWWNYGGSRDSGNTTQNPSVLCIGPAGENLCAVSAIMSEAGHAAGQGGMGAVAGSKNLKAISCLGTGSVVVADPASLLGTRLEVQDKFGYNVDKPKNEDPVPSFAMLNFMTHAPASSGVGWNPQDYLARAEGCTGCFRNCRAIFSDTVGNQAVCFTSIFYNGSQPQDFLKASDILNKLGINGFEKQLVEYPYALYKKGVLGKGKKIDTKIDFSQYGSIEFFEKLMKAVAYKKDIGKQLADGVAAACKEWGRWDKDTKVAAADGGIERPVWGYTMHYEPRVSTEWGFGSLFTERDLDDHSYNQIAHWAPMMRQLAGLKPLWTAEETVNTMAKSTGLNDPMCWNYGPDGTYSDANMRGVEWIIEYNRFWGGSMGLCGFTWPILLNTNNPDDPTGAAPDYEPRFYKAVTGEDLSWEDSLQRGKKYYLMDRAIWCLQGRDRDDEVFTDYIYDVKCPEFILPAYKNGKWVWDDCKGRTLDRKKVEDYKTRFYKLEGCDEKTGVPTRETLEGLDLKDFADALDKAGRY